MLYVRRGLDDDVRKGSLERLGNATYDEPSSGP